MISRPKHPRLRKNAAPISHTTIGIEALKAKLLEANKRADDATAARTAAEARANDASRRVADAQNTVADTNVTMLTNAIDMVRRIHARGATILFVEHNMRAVLELTDRLIVLNQGRLIADGAPRAVMDDPAVIAAYLGAPDAAH